MTACWASLDTAIGPLLVVGGPDGLCTIRFPDPAGGLAAPDTTWSHDQTALAPALAQLRAYFTGGLQHFDLPLAPRGTPFQRSVWSLLATVPWGQTTTYGALATTLGKPGAARAVGHANGSTPRPLVLPCRRVIGADGSLTGFGGGLAAKRWLLRHEGVAIPEQRRLF